MTALQRLAEVVRRGRAASGLSQSQLATKVGLRRDVIKRLEAGADTKCSIVLAVWSALDLDTKDLHHILKETS